MRTQLARLKVVHNFLCKRLMSTLYTGGPFKRIKTIVSIEMELLGPNAKHWYCGGQRSTAVAVNLLENTQIIAVPTDTIYGLAGLASSNLAISRLYKIKGRDENKPLAICVTYVSDIKKYAVVDGLQEVLDALLPGPVTVILKRMPNLNPSLNPGIDSIAVRVVQHPFIKSITKLAGPLALTSANKSNERSTVHPSEFEELWPELDGIFYDVPNYNALWNETRRQGSTIVDLTHAGHYKIVREGMALKATIETCQYYALTPIQNE